MNQKRLQYLICPECHSEKFGVKDYLSEGDDLIEGQLVCKTCNNWFRIENGILDLLPLRLRRLELYQPFAAKHGLPMQAQPAPLPADEVIIQQIAYFKSEAMFFDKTTAGNPFYLSFDEMTFINWMRTYLEPGDLVLDIGCGTGRQYGRFKEFGLNSIGVDISEEMLIEARKKVVALGLREAIDHVVGDAGNPPVKENSFDACVIYGVLHHLPSPKSTIGSSAKKLRTGAAFFSLDPHKSPVRFLYDWLVKMWKLYNEETGSEPLFSEEELTQWLTAANIKPKITLNAYLPPHLYMITPRCLHKFMVTLPDTLIRKIPYLRKMAGGIMVEGIKISSV